MWTLSKRGALVAGLATALIGAFAGAAEIAVPNGDFEETETVILGDPCPPVQMVRPTDWSSWYDVPYDQNLYNDCDLIDGLLSVRASSDSHTGSGAMSVVAGARLGFSEGTAQTVVLTQGSMLPSRLTGFYRMPVENMVLQPQVYFFAGEGEFDLDLFLLCHQTLAGCVWQQEFELVDATVDLEQSVEYTEFAMDIPTLSPAQAAEVWVIVIRFRLIGGSSDVGEEALIDDLSFEFQCAEDLDGDGMVGFSDLTLLLANWGPCPDGEPCPADIAPVGALDGLVGFADLTQLLAKWGACP